MTMIANAARTWKLILSYDGSDFHGWQVQPHLPTIQGELREAIARITGETVLPQGSGRTDAGVHALSQVASFALSAPIPETNLLRALNRTLPPTIRVRSARIMPEGFHARHSAVAKTYEYRIFCGEICPAWVARYAYATSRHIDWEAMQRSAKSVLGEHDFTSFAASDPSIAERKQKPPSRAGEPVSDSFPAAEEPPQNNVRILTHSEWLTGACTWRDIEAAFLPGIPPLHGEMAAGDAAAAGAFLAYRVRGNGFLHHMVRNLVGTFLEIGRGNLREGGIPRILAARARAAAGPTAPARGLFLREVEYPENLR